jgi:hypothetical protein
MAEIPSASQEGELARLRYRNRETTIWSASAMMASIMAARKREPGEIVMVS